ncbi:MAG: hypothetical protein RL217_326 [Pseudomonadota bacterium]
MIPTTFVQNKDYLSLSLPKPWQALSSAVLNGGLTQAHALLNLRVDANASTPYPPAAQSLLQKVQELTLPANCIGMMTAASMDSLGYCLAQKQGLSVEVYCTAGIANLRRPGDRADECPQIGTINIWLLIHQALTDAALVEALMQLTEAKTTAIRDLGLISPLSLLPASGTGTDSHAVLCPIAPQPLAYCGKHTALGELIGRAALDACTQSLTKCLHSVAK